MRYKPLRDIPHYRASGEERLAQLAAFLEDLPPGKLTFARWYGQGRGCAVGLAAAGHPWFAAQGLRLEREDSLKDCRPAYVGSSDWMAVTAFFEISTADARQLFDRRGYDGEIEPAPGRVAKKIHRYLASTPAQAMSA